MISRQSYVFLIFFTFLSCIPSKPIELRNLEIKDFKLVTATNIILNTESEFYNPNATRIRLKQIYLDIFVSGKKVGFVDQEINELIMPKSNFKLSTEIQLDLSKSDLFSSVLSLFGSQNVEILITGRARVVVNGIPLNVPFEIKDQFKF